MATPGSGGGEPPFVTAVRLRAEYEAVNAGFKTVAEHEATIAAAKAAASKAAAAELVAAEKAAWEPLTTALATLAAGEPVEALPSPPPPKEWYYRDYDEEADGEPLGLLHVEVRALLRA